MSALREKTVADHIHIGLTPDGKFKSAHMVTETVIVRDGNVVGRGGLRTIAIGADTKPTLEDVLGEFAHTAIAELNDAKAKIKDLVDEIDQAREQMATMSSTIEEQTHVVVALHSDLKMAGGIIDQQGAQLAHYSGQIAKLKSDVIELEALLEHQAKKPAAAAVEIQEAARSAPSRRRAFLPPRR